MSVYALAWAKRQVAGGVAAKAVLLVLADYADERGTCWPSQETIARECELTDRSVRDQLVRLEAAGLITRSKARKRDGTQDSDRFELAVSRNELPADRNVVPPDTSRNVVPDQPERHSEPAGTTFQVTTIDPPEDPPLVDVSAPARRQRKRGEKFVPDSWEPSAAIIEFGAGEGLNPGEIERALAAMRDHEFRDGKTDWDRTARRWLRTTAERSNSGRTHDRPRSDQPINRRAEARSVWADIAAQEASAGAGGDVRPGGRAGGVHCRDRSGAPLGH